MKSMELSRRNREAVENVRKSLPSVSDADLLAWHLHARDRLQSAIKDHVVVLLQKELRKRGLRVIG